MHSPGGLARLSTFLGAPEAALRLLISILLGKPNRFFSPLCYPPLRYDKGRFVLLRWNPNGILVFYPLFFFLSFSHSRDFLIYFGPLRPNQSAFIHDSAQSPT